MTHVESSVREALQEMSEQETPPVPNDFADRALRGQRRRRVRTVIAAGAASVALVAGAATVPALTPGDGDQESAANSVPTRDVLARPGESPPKKLVAAGDTAMSAYTTQQKVDQPNGDIVHKTNWHLYDPSSGGYEQSDWAWADVAPQLRKAAVLKGPLPTTKVGILDLESGEVDRWIELDHKAAGVSWSPDGSRLLATTYSKNPDRRFKDHPVNVNGKERPGPLATRTGYAVIDADSGKSHWFKNPADKDKYGFAGNPRSDFEWSSDGRHVFKRNLQEPMKTYYDLDGDEWDAPKGYTRTFSSAGLSPDGRHHAGDFAGEGDEIATNVLDAESGEAVAKQPVQELLAWADNDRLLAWGCGGTDDCGGKSEFRQQLLLVDMNGKTVRKLTGFRDGKSGKAWEPEFSPR